MFLLIFAPTSIKFGVIREKANLRLYVFTNISGPILMVSFRQNCDTVTGVYFDKHSWWMILIKICAELINIQTSFSSRIREIFECIT